MKIGERVSAAITSQDSAYSGKTLLLDVEEWCPYEPSAYCWTPGWNCAVEIAGESVWFFIDEAGVVWEDNTEVGLCPSQEEEYEMRIAADAAIEAKYEMCNCGDPGDCGEVH